MFEPGNVLHGIFCLSDTLTKPKYAIILHKDNDFYILATFTTSQKRSGSVAYVHGKNPKGSKEPKSYVFLSTQKVGSRMVNGVVEEYNFPYDTTVVPDYGLRFTSIVEFKKNVTNLKLVCSLYEREYLDLIYTLYQCKKTPREYKKIYEHILSTKVK